MSKKKRRAQPVSRKPTRALRRAAETNAQASEQPLELPAPRRVAGRVLFAEEVREQFFGNGVSAWWVRRNVAPTHKIKLGHSTVGWFEADVVQWINDRRGK